MVYTVAIVSINKSSAIADTASQCFINRIIAFACGYLFDALFFSSLLPENTATNHIHYRKLDSLGCMFVADVWVCNFN